MLDSGYWMLGAGLSPAAWISLIEYPASSIEYQLFVEP
jgi:hypothetical protein